MQAFGIQIEADLVREFAGSSSSFRLMRGLAV